MASRKAFCPWTQQSNFPGCCSVSTMAVGYGGARSDRLSNLEIFGQI